MPPFFWAGLVSVVAWASNPSHIGANHFPPMISFPNTSQHRASLITLAVVAVAYSISFFHRFAPAGIAQDLAAAFQTSATALGVLAATYFYVYTLMQVPTGILVDTLGPRRILLMGGVVAGLGSMGFGLAHSLEGALVGRTVVGLGVSVTFIAMLKMVAVAFEEQRFATVVGACMVIGNLGSVLAGVPLTYGAQLVGWRSIFVGAGVISLLLGVACWLLVRDAPHPAHAAASGRGAARAPSVGASVLSVLKNRASWPATVVNAGVAGSFFAFGGLWAVPFLTQVHGLSRTAASTHLSLYFAGFAVGCLLIGSLSDRLGKRKPVAIVASHINLAVWVFWVTGMTVPVAVSTALFALMGACAACVVLTWACAKEVNPPALSGMSTSVTNMGGFLASALLQPLVGLAMDLNWSGTLVNGVRVYAADDLRLGMGLMAAVAALGAAWTWRLQETGCRNIWVEPPRSETL